MSKRIYLASPYSHEDRKVRKARFDAVCWKAAELMEEGFIVFSPIAHSHSIAQHMLEKRVCDFDFWIEQDLDYIRLWADELYVFCLYGWAASKGVLREIKLAVELGKSIHFLNVEGNVR